MSSSGAVAPVTVAIGQAVTAGYLTILFLVDALFDLDGVPILFAAVFAVAAAALLARHRVLVCRGRLATTTNRLTPRRASGNAAVFLTAMALLNGIQPLLHGGRWTGLYDPAFLTASLTTAAVAAVVWLLLVRRDRRRNSPLPA